MLSQGWKHSVMPRLCPWGAVQLAFLDKPCQSVSHITGWMTKREFSWLGWRTHGLQYSTYWKAACKIPESSTRTLDKAHYLSWIWFGKSKTHLIPWHLQVGGQLQQLWTVFTFPQFFGGSTREKVFLWEQKSCCILQVSLMSHKGMHRSHF